MPRNKKCKQLQSNEQRTVKTEERGNETKDYQSSSETFANKVSYNSEGLIGASPLVMDPSAANISSDRFDDNNKQLLSSSRKRSRGNAIGRKGYRHDEDETILSGDRSTFTGAQEPDLRWKTVDEVDSCPNQIPPFQPRRTPGPQVPVRAESYSMLEFFMLFFPRELVTEICERMEVYVARKRASHKINYSLGSSFGPDMFYSFIATVIYMGLQKNPSIRDYWSKTMLSQPYLLNGPMSGNCFQNIMRSLHFTTEQEDEELKRKKNSGEPQNHQIKIQLLNEAIRETFREYMAPDIYLSIDERTVATRIKRRNECCKNKPGKYAVKLWVVVCPTTGYTFNFEVDVGEKGEDTRQKWLSFSVVQNLMHSYVHCGHRVMLDRFYLSHELFENLFLQNIMCLTAVHENQPGFPWNAANALCDESKRGEIRWFRQGAVCFFQWKDEHVISMASTCHSGNEVTTITRKVLNERSRKVSTIVIPQPQCMKEYDRSIRIVDLDEELDETHFLLRESNKWYRKVFFYLVNLAVRNCFIIYSKIQVDSGLPEPSSKEARMALIEGLYGMVVRNHYFPSASQNMVVPMTSSQLVHHVPIYNSKKGTCHLCSMLHLGGPRRRTTTYCEACDVALCFNSDRNCFREFHKNYFVPK